MKGLAQNYHKGTQKDNVAELLGLLLLSRDYAHLAHWKTGSYADHKALDTFYTELLELTDELAEAAQGVYGKLNVSMSGMKENVSDPIAVLQKHVKKVEMLADGCEGRAINAIVDQIAQLYLETIYKLKELS